MTGITAADLKRQVQYSHAEARKVKKMPALAPQNLLDMGNHLKSVYQLRKPIILNAFTSYPHSLVFLAPSRLCVRLKP
jgi:hypothetical protein